MDLDGSELPLATLLAMQVATSAATSLAIQLNNGDYSIRDLVVKRNLKSLQEKKTYWHGGRTSS